MGSIWDWGNDHERKEDLEKIARLNREISIKEDDMYRTAGEQKPERKETLAAKMREEAIKNKLKVDDEQAVRCKDKVLHLISAKTEIGETSLYWSFTVCGKLYPSVEEFLRSEGFKVENCSPSSNRPNYGFENYNISW